MYPERGLSKLPKCRKMGTSLFVVRHIRVIQVGNTIQLGRILRRISEVTMTLLKLLCSVKWRTLLIDLLSTRIFVGWKLMSIIYGRFFVGAFFFALIEADYEFASLLIFSS